MMKRVAIALFVVACLASAGPLLRADQDHGVAVPTVLALRPSEARHLSVESAGQRVEFIRSPVGDWRAGPASPPQSATLLLGSEDRLLPVLGYKALRVDPSDPQFGLVSPQIVLEVGDAAGRHRTIHIGAATFSGGGFYARRVGEDGRVVLVPRRIMSDLRSVVSGRPETAADPVRDKARRIEAERAEEAARASISRHLEQALQAGARMPEGLE